MLKREEMLREFELLRKEGKSMQEIRSVLKQNYHSKMLQRYLPREPVIMVISVSSGASKKIYQILREYHGNIELKLICKNNQVEDVKEV